jgi:hypothetical protein
MKFKVAGQGFFFPLSKAKSLTGITDTNKGIKKKKSKPSATSYSTLGDMLLHKYTVDFIATLKGDKAVITGGELGEWRLTQYSTGTIFSQLQNRPNTSPISIEHNCGKDGNLHEEGVEWVWAMTPGEDRRRRLCAGCKKRVPETIRGLIKLIE